MAVKKIIHNALEDAFEAGKKIVQSSGQQIKETFSPWDMIANSFGEQKNPQDTQMKDLKEMMGKTPNATPLNREKLKETHDQKDLAVMRQKLFQMVKGQDEKLLLENKQKKAEAERSVAFEEMQKERQLQEQQRLNGANGNPHGKEHKNIMGGKKKKRTTDLPPMEAKPGQSKN
jgi:hypothetical protein